jgi:hypothetical protein
MSESKINLDKLHHITLDFAAIDLINENINQAIENKNKES